LEVTLRERTVGGQRQGRSVRFLRREASVDAGHEHRDAERHGTDDERAKKDVHQRHATIVARGPHGSEPAHPYR
jgi:hypothetical protein